MSDFPLPLAAGVVLLVLLGFILLRRFRTADNAATRDKRRRASAGEDYNGYFNLRDGVGSGDGDAATTSCGDSAGTGCSAGGGDGGRGD
jgi:hypothetical protein